ASLRTMGRIAEPRSFNDLVVATLSGVPVRVRDIGYAEDGTKEQRSAARLNGVPTVIMEVRRQSGENTVAVIEGVKGKLARLRDQVPPDVKLEVIRDQSRYIYAALHEINLHLVLGSILASLVVLSFMSSISGRFLYQFGLTAAVSVLVSLLVSFSLTPMMCARLLRAEDAASGHAEGAHAGSRGGFYAWIDRAYAWSLAWSMRHRWV